MSAHQRNNNPKIFINYAREDESRVIEIYQNLESNGFDPWMDIYNILPGEVWENKIKEAINKSDFFIACLSINSSQKRGIIQKEIKSAFEKWHEKLESDIYLIPIRLDDCEVPEKMRKIQWINLFENKEQNWQRVIDAIKAGWKRLGHTSDKELEATDNPSLIENNFLHLEYELEQENRNFLRIVKETHTALYRTMIEALRGSANISITGISTDLDKIIKYKRGNEPWMEIRKNSIPRCIKAWRFSDPKECKEPEINYERQKSVNSDNHLIGFFDALAMIQTENYMGSYIFSKAVHINDEDMKTIEILYYYRKKFDYFIPTSLLAHKSDIQTLLTPCLRIIKALLFESGNIMLILIPKGLKPLIDKVSNKI